MNKAFSQKSRNKSAFHETHLVRQIKRALSVAPFDGKKPPLTLNEIKRSVPRVSFVIKNKVIPLCEHPLKNEVYEKLQSGELVAS